MTAHELANYLLTLPDYPVIINGWGSDEGVDCEVVGGHIHESDDKPPVIYLSHELLEW